MSRLRRSWWVLAVLALGCVFAYPMQVNGYNQNAHYALVRAVAVHHVANVDRSLNEIGQVSTGDVARYHGHSYAAKAPGLAITTVPAFVVVRALGMRTVGDPTRVIWALHLWSIVLPALVMVLLVRWLGERIEPGFGRMAALTFGLATLVLPFGTLFFSHVLSAAFAFAGFALLWYERDRPPRLALVALAGALGGLAVFVEYALAFVALIVGLYAVSRGNVLLRAAAYAAGAGVGIAPLLLFNWWAFGSPTHLAYEDYVQQRGPGRGLLGFDLPSVHATSQILFSSMGLLTLTPVVACGVAGAFLLFRSRPREALVVLGVVAGNVLYNVSLRYLHYYSPFGGLGPPRYLVALAPFAAVPLAVAFRAFPLTTIALALVSAFQMVVMTATGPLAAYDGGWLHRFRSHDFVQTGASIVGVTGWYAITPYFLAVLVAVACTIVAVRRPVFRRRELPLAAVALLGWAAIAVTAENPNGQPPSNSYVAAAVVVVGAAVLALAWLYGPESRWRLTLRPARSPR